MGSSPSRCASSYTGTSGAAPPAPPGETLSCIPGGCSASRPARRWRPPRQPAFAPPAARPMPCGRTPWRWRPGRTRKRLRSGGRCSAGPGIRFPGLPQPEPGTAEAPDRGAGAVQPAPEARIVVGGGTGGRRRHRQVAVALIDNSGDGKPAAGQPADSVPTTGPRPRRRSGRRRKPRLRRAATPKSLAPPRPRRRARPRRPIAPRRGPLPSATTKPTPTATDIHPDADRRGHPGNPGRLPVRRRAAGTAGRHHDLADRRRRPGDLVEHRVQRVGTVQLSPAGGTINAGATVTVTVTASGSASGRQVTINPGGTVFTIFVTLGKQARRRRTESPPGSKAARAGPAARRTPCAVSRI